MEIEKFHWKTEEAFNRIKQGRPVVLKECPIVHPSYADWTLENIANWLKEDFPCDVYVSDSLKFPYWDEAKNTYKYDFTAPTTKISMSFREFLLTLKDQDEKPSDGKKFHYLHQSLVAEMGPKILEEYSKFSLQTAALYKLLAGWSELTHNLMLCGKAGYVTPVHFDEQENLFTQLQGRKRVRIFSPQAWYGLYTYPNGHSQDRQAQVTLPSVPGSPNLDTEEDRFRFPAYQKIVKYEMFVDLDPGDVLYIPQYFFHQMEGLTDNISLSWWFKHSNRGKEIDFENIKLDEISLIAIRRNIEGAMAHMAGFGKRAQSVFLSIASGRTRIPGIEHREAPSSSGDNKKHLDAPTNEETETETPEYITNELLVVDTDAGALKLSDAEEEVCKVIADQALSMLNTLIPSQYTSGFLLQVVSGRFNAF